MKRVNKCKKHKAPCGLALPRVRRLPLPRLRRAQDVHFHTALTVCLLCGELPER